jgi:hypothetical protein
MHQTLKLLKSETLTKKLFFLQINKKSSLASSSTSRQRAAGWRDQHN